MIFDIQNRYSASQALTSTTTSTNAIDHGSSDRDIADGKSIVVHLAVKVAASDSNGDETYEASLETASDEAFSFPVTIDSVEIPRGSAAGTRFMIPIGQGMLRYSRVKYTLGGSSPSVTITADLLPEEFAQRDVAYQKNYTITAGRSTFT